MFIEIITGGGGSGRSASKSSRPVRAVSPEQTEPKTGTIPDKRRDVSLSLTRGRSIIKAVVRRYLATVASSLVGAFRRIVRPHLTVVVVFLGGLVSGVLVHQLEKYFDDRDRATIKVASNNPTIREFGIVQIRQAEGPTRRRRLREGKGSVLAVTVPAGEYDIRLWVLGEIVLDEERGIEKGTTLRYSDADLRHPPELFPDQDFVEIPAGVFTQGSTDFPQSSPPHEVSLSAFRIRSVPVTACEYASYLAAEGYFQAGDLADDVKLCSVQADGTKPAAGLTWYDANRFCQWLSVKKHRSFRLPTEAEYERAMRVAHPRSKYPWGDSEYDPDRGPVPQANR